MVEGRETEARPCGFADKSQYLSGRPGSLALHWGGGRSLDLCPSINLFNRL